MMYAKKSLGQNFLIDLNIIKKIINLAKITNKNILEIGPGRGALTDQILKNNPKSLIIIEKDNILSNELKLKYSDNKKVTVYNKDVLKFNLEKKLKKDTIIFGNLPYNIASQILANIIKFKEWPPRYSRLILMFQKEMADRITGKFGTPYYGRLSILTNYRLNILNKFNVSSNCFFPKPKVDSTILFFKPNLNTEIKINDIVNLEQVTKTLFSNKRKMINKSIKKIFKGDKKISIIEELNLTSRPSELKPEKYYKITKIFEQM